MRIVMIGSFGLRAKSTVRERALPLARSLVKRGHTVAIVIPPWDSPEDAGQSWTDFGVSVVHTALPRLPEPLHAIRLTTWLVKAALGQHPDVIHCFKPKAYSGLAQLLLYTLRRLKPKTWRLVIDEDDWEQAWNEINPYSRLEKALFAWQEPWGLKHADAVTVASRELACMVAEVRGTEAQVYYVPNGVQTLPTATDISSPDRVRAEHGLVGHPTILVLTRFVEFAVASLVDIVRETAQRMPLARWVVVGTGYFGEERELAQALEREGLAGTTHFAGWVQAQDLPGYYAAADTALHLYEDTVINRTKCSVRLLELMAAGVPVVASAVGQNVAYIDDGRTGLLVPAGDVKAHASALVTLLTEPETRRRISEAAAGHVRSMFSWDRLALEAERAYLGEPPTT